MIKHNCIANIVSIVQKALLGLRLPLGFSSTADDEPRQVVYEASVAVSMRDGVVLRANINRPDGARSCPCDTRCEWGSRRLSSAV